MDSASTPEVEQRAPPRLFDPRRKEFVRLSSLSQETETEPPDSLVNDQRPLFDGNKPDLRHFIDVLCELNNFATLPASQGNGEQEELYRYEEARGIYNGYASSYIRDWCDAQFRRQGRACPKEFKVQVIDGVKCNRTKVPREEFDHGDLFCVPNGILDLQGPAPQLTLHDPHVHFFRSLATPYIPGATCPQFLSHIEYALPDQRDRDLLQEECGYPLVRGQPYKKAALWIGLPNTGKTAIGEVLAGVLGRENVAAVSLQELDADRFAKADLEGRLASVCADMPVRTVKDVGTFKMLLGRDIVSVQRKYQQRSEMVNSCKLFYSANELPKVPADDAFFDRWNVTEFLKPIPPERRDPHWAEKIIREEASGVLNWLLEGRARLLSRGGFRVEGDSPSAKVADKWRRYSDSLAWFVAEKCRYKEKGEVSKPDLMASYVEFCADNGVDPASPWEVGNRLPTLLPKVHASNPKPVLGRKGKQARFWVNLEVLEEAQDPSERPPPPNLQSFGGPAPERPGTA